MTTKLSKKEQLTLVAMAASLKVEWVGEDNQFAQLPTRDWKDWDPFESNDDAKELADYMGFSVEVNKRLNRTIVSNGLREYAVSHGRDGKT